MSGERRAASQDRRRRAETAAGNRADLFEIGTARRSRFDADSMDRRTFDRPVPLENRYVDAQRIKIRREHIENLPDNHARFSAWSKVFQYSTVKTRGPHAYSKTALQPLTSNAGSS